MAIEQKNSSEEIPIIAEGVASNLGGLSPHFLPFIH